jgi:hypothetical protein
MGSRVSSRYRGLYGPGDAEIVAERFARTIREFGYEF